MGSVDAQQDNIEATFYNKFLLISLPSSSLHKGNRVAKCHEYDEYIRVKMFSGRGKKSERTQYD